MANNQALIQVRVDKKTRDEAEKALNNKGVSVNEAIRAMLHSIAATGKTPFDGLFENHFEK